MGVSTNKLLSKLVGNLHKPNNQTTLLPPYTSHDDEHDNVTPFVDSHEVGRIPGIGFKLAQKLRAYVLQRPPKFDDGLVYGGTKESVLVGDVRGHPGMSPETLEQILGGPGTPHGIGARVWDLLNGCDVTEVGKAREVPKQISLEDSYVRLDTLDQVIKELLLLSKSLIKRMRTDLLEDIDDQTETNDEVAVDRMDIDHSRKRWLAFPKTIRLSTRPRPAQNPDGSRNRSFARISRSAAMPNFIFSLRETLDSLSDRLVSEILVPLFRKLHPEKSGWNLSLVNIAATNMVDAASSKGGAGRDIAKMFMRQDDFLKQFRIQEEIEDAGMEENEMDESKMEGDRMDDVHEQEIKALEKRAGGSEDIPTRSQEEYIMENGEWESEDAVEEEMNGDDSFECDQCGAVMPLFAVAAHSRWHEHDGESLALANFKG